MTAQKVEESGGLVSLSALLKGILAAYIITIPVFLLFALILSLTSYPDRMIMPVVIVTTVVSVLAAGWFSTAMTKSRGWLNGGIAGLVYMLILYIAGSIAFKNFHLDSYVFTISIIGVLTGMIGGIFGVNVRISRTRHKKWAK